MSIDFDVNKVLDQLGQFIAAKGPVAYDAAVNVVVSVRADDTVSTFAPGTWYHVAATPENG